HLLHGRRSVRLPRAGRRALWRDESGALLRDGRRRAAGRVRGLEALEGPESGSVGLRVLALSGQRRLFRQNERVGRQLLRIRDDPRGPLLHGVTVPDDLGLGCERRERSERRALVFGDGSPTAVALSPPTHGVLVAI